MYEGQTEQHRQGVVIKFVRTVYEATLPRKAHADDAGFDLYAAERVILSPHERAAVPTGFKVAIPQGYVGLVCSRSGLAFKRGVFVLNAPGIIDAGYRGELKVILQNTNPDKIASFEFGDRIGQLFLQKLPPTTVVEVDGFEDETTRGEGGFGSSGK